MSICMILPSQPPESILVPRSGFAAFLWDWKALEGTLHQEIAILSAYFKTWGLKLSNVKTMMATFH